MTSSDAILAAFMTFSSAGISALVWGTYRRLEHRSDGIEHRIDRLEERMDHNFASVRADITQNFASVRADITQIALAVGANPRPHASEG